MENENNSEDEDSWGEVKLVIEPERDLLPFHTKNKKPKKPSQVINLVTPHKAKPIHRSPNIHRDSSPCNSGSYINTSKLDEQLLKNLEDLASKANIPQVLQIDKSQKPIKDNIHGSPLLQSPQILPYNNLPTTPQSTILSSENTPITSPKPLYFHKNVIINNLTQLNRQSSPTVGINITQTNFSQTTLYNESDYFLEEIPTFQTFPKTSQRKKRKVIKYHEVLLPPPNSSKSSNVQKILAIPQEEELKAEINSIEEEIEIDFKSDDNSQSTAGVLSKSINFSDNSYNSFRKIKSGSLATGKLSDRFNRLKKRRSSLIHMSNHFYQFDPSRSDPNNSNQTIIRLYILSIQPFSGFYLAKSLILSLDNITDPPISSSYHHFFQIGSLIFNLFSIDIVNTLNIKLHSTLSIFWPFEILQSPYYDFPLLIISLCFESEPQDIDSELIKHNENNQNPSSILIPPSNLPSPSIMKEESDIFVTTTQTAIPKNIKDITVFENDNFSLYGIIQRIINLSYSSSHSSIAIGLERCDNSLIYFQDTTGICEIRIPVTQSNPSISHLLSVGEGQYCLLESVRVKNILSGTDLSNNHHYQTFFESFNPENSFKFSQLVVLNANKNSSFQLFSTPISQFPLSISYIPYHNNMSIIQILQTNFSFFRCNLVLCFILYFEIEDSSSNSPFLKLFVIDTVHKPMNILMIISQYCHHQAIVRSFFSNQRYISIRHILCERKKDKLFCSLDNFSLLIRPENQQENCKTYTQRDIQTGLYISTFGIYIDHENFSNNNALEMEIEKENESDKEQNENTNGHSIVSIYDSFIQKDKGLKDFFSLDVFYSFDDILNDIALYDKIHHQLFFFQGIIQKVYPSPLSPLSSTIYLEVTTKSQHLVQISSDSSLILKYQLENQSIENYCQTFYQTKFHWICYSDKRDLDLVSTFSSSLNSSKPYQALLKMCRPGKNHPLTFPPIFFSTNEEIIC